MYYVDLTINNLRKSKNNKGRKSGSDWIMGENIPFKVRSSLGLVNFEELMITRKGLRILYESIEPGMHSRGRRFKKRTITGILNCMKYDNIIRKDINEILQPQYDSNFRGENVWKAINIWVTSRRIGLFVRYPAKEYITLEKENDLKYRGSGKVKYLPYDPELVFMVNPYYFRRKDGMYSKFEKAKWNTAVGLLHKKGSGNGCITTIV